MIFLYAKDIEILIAPEKLPKINRLLYKLSKKDKYTTEHSIAVANTAKKYAEIIGLKPDEVLFLYYCGLLHDVGKLYIPLFILNKPAKLNKIERYIINFHPFFSFLKTKRINKKISVLILQHHEKEATDFFKDIIIASDVYCALKEERSYKKPFDFPKIKKIFEEENLVPAIREHFLSVIET